jgi:hypothetical protein
MLFLFSCLLFIFKRKFGNILKAAVLFNRAEDRKIYEIIVNAKLFYPSLQLLFEILGDKIDTIKTTRKL